MLEISNVKLPLDVGLPQGETLVREAAVAALGVRADDVVRADVLKRSVDARKKSNVHFVATLGAELVDRALEQSVLSRVETQAGSGMTAGTQIKQHKPYEPLFIPALHAALDMSNEPRVVVVGSGPAGLFAALYLARAGLRPLVIERGAAVDERLQVIAAFEAGGTLNSNTNIQFGEGGAGTFSDGKLTTNVKNPLTAHVLRWFVDAGAPEEILWQAKPHIGTDLLVEVVRHLREQIIEAGGEVCFHTQLTKLNFAEGTLAEIEVHNTQTGVTQFLETHRLILACGHSARDTFEAVCGAGVHMEQKPFSVGVRIEHPQAVINRAQYGEAASHPALGAADYKLAVHLPQGRSVYTFCMCPGGEVVCAASEPESVVVNGMSRFARSEQNANSAVLVGVNPEDFGSSDVLAGVNLQRQMERAAYEVALRAGGSPYSAPAQTVGNFLSGEAGVSSNAVEPSYARKVAWCDLHECLPPFVADALTDALPLLDRKLQGFADAQAVMTGVETRSSSPVRIVRNEKFEAMMASGCASSGARELGDNTVASGLYPCGEGAGYAGGIMSAACDGLRVAQAVTQEFR